MIFPIMLHQSTTVIWTDFPNADFLIRFRLFHLLLFLFFSFQMKLLSVNDPPPHLWISSSFSSVLEFHQMIHPPPSLHPRISSFSSFLEFPSPSRHHSPTPLVYSSFSSSWDSLHFPPRLLRLCSFSS